MPARPGRRELLALLAILALAAVLRLPGLDERGRWDADQGHDMLVLRALATDGEVPLLGPRTSIGTFHHGAVYYYILAPAALLSGADPIAVTGEIALIGIAAVAATWWLGRLLAGSLAGLAAALLAALSPAGIDESTFIWNPNLIPLAAALAFGGAIRAWQARAPRWWLLSGAGAMVTMQCHILGVVVLPPLLLLFVADVWRRRRDAEALGPVLRAGLGASLIIIAGYLPLAIHELGHDFSETRAILAYLAGGGGSSELGLAGRLAMVGLRSVAWPLVGLITDRPAATIVVVTIAVSLMGTVAITRRTTTGAGSGRPLTAWWLLATLAWSVVALAMFSPGLAVVTPGLPNDHYHAFLDPLVLALVGAGLAVVARGGRTASRAPAGALGGSSTVSPALAGALGRRGTVSPALAGALAAVLVAAAILGWPPRVADDGGWRLVDEAAARVVSETAGADGVALAGIPPFKSADALRFPLERRGLVPLAEEANGGSGTVTVVVCDPLFDAVVGMPCGGPAEDAWAADHAAGQTGALRLTGRFEAGPRRVISIYTPAIRRRDPDQLQATP